MMLVLHFEFVALKIVLSMVRLKLFFTVFSIHVLFLTMFSQEKTQYKFTLTGKVIGQDTGVMRLSYLNAYSKGIQDTCYLTNGKFSFTGFVDEPTAAILRGKVRNRSINDPNAIQLFLEPAEMNITAQVGDFIHANISGSEAQNQLNVLLKEEDLILKEEKPLDDAWIEVISALQKDENNQVLKSRADSIHIAFQPYNEKLKHIRLQFIASNPDSYVSPYILIPYVDKLSADSTMMLYSNFTNRIKVGRLGKVLKNEISKQAVASLGDIAKNFLTNDVNGNQISLAFFKGRNIILLDFWASWCIPCRKGNPHLIELYKQYHFKGLEIIGIAMDDDNPKAWKAAIDKDKIGIWNHVLQGKNGEKLAKGQANENDIGEQYGIQAIPVRILIDRSGTIVGRYEGDDDTELDKKLAELFKQ